MSGFVVWMTGLSGAGKSTLATRLTQELSNRGVHVECLDGDEVRKNLSHGLGFARDDRDRNVRRIGYVARMVARSGACAITAAISPYRALREEIRSKTENFFEVYCECPLEVLTERDPKGLYKRALAGEIKNFTGVDDPYEAPEDPEVHVRTDLLSVEESLEKIIGALHDKGLLGRNSRGFSALPPPFGGEVFEARLAHGDDLSKVDGQVEISKDLAQQVAAIAAGYCSPVTGFMTQREAVKVQKNQALERGTPWWDEPFVLPLGADASNWKEGQRGALLLDGKEVASFHVEQVWEEDGKAYLAGPLDSVVSREGPSAREFRRIANENGAQTVGSLFVAAGPSEALKPQLSTACELLDMVALGVPTSQRSAWAQFVKDMPRPPQVVGLPDAFPFDNARARLVVQKSLGASANKLLA